MSRAGDNKYSKQAEKMIRTLNQAIIKARKKYKDKYGELPEGCYHFHWRDGMTCEEELLEIFHALVRSGMSPDEAKEKAPAELEHIHILIKDQEEHNG